MDYHLPALDIVFFFPPSALQLDALNLLNRLGIGRL